MRRLICFVIGHADETLQQDGIGAAWKTCNRCGKVMGAHSYHGAKPWEQEQKP